MTHNFLQKLNLADTLLHMTSKYMEPVTEPYLGFRLRPRYTRLVSTNPANAGHLFRDINGRPSGAVLASLYLGPGHYAYIDGNIFILYGPYHNNI